MESENVNYFILGGLIPIARRTKDIVRIPQLVKIISEKKPKEIILALSVHPDADHTISFLAEKLKTEFDKYKDNHTWSRFIKWIRA